MHTPDFVKIFTETWNHFVAYLKMTSQLIQAILPTHRTPYDGPLDGLVVFQVESERLLRWLGHSGYPQFGHGFLLGQIQFEDLWGDLSLFTVQLVLGSDQLRVVFKRVTLQLLRLGGLLGGKFIEIHLDVRRRPGVVLCLLQGTAGLVADRTDPPATGGPGKADLVEALDTWNTEL